MKIPYVGPYKLVTAKQGDAGYDIRADETFTIYSKTSAAVGTNLRMAIPRGYVGKVVSRSGLAFKHSIEVGAGIIDSGYRGEIRIKLYNHGDHPFHIEKGDRIAQLLIQKHESPWFEQTDTLDETERGDNGFGHTGVN